MVPNPGNSSVMSCWIAMARGHAGVTQLWRVGGRERGRGVPALGSHSPV